MNRMTRRAEGAEKELKKSDYHPIIRGGTQVGYLIGYPHPSGSWIAKLE